MPNKLDKIAPFVAAAVLGYLAYGVMDAGAVSVAPGKDAPAITKSMLKPEMVAAQGHSSPAGRDPFEVAWASYLHPNKPGVSAAAIASAPESETEEAQPPAGAAKPGPAVDVPPPPPPPPPPLPSLSSVSIRRNSEPMAIMGGRVYRAGDTVKGEDSGAGWVIESIESSQVVLRFGDVRHTLRIALPGAASHEQKKTGGKP